MKYPKMMNLVKPLKKNCFKMKLKVKVKEIVKGCFPVYHDNGDYFDLKTANNVSLIAGRSYNLRLGVAIELPKGMFAKIESRSSTYGVFKIKPTSSFVIDNSYKGDSDEWHFIVKADKNVFIPKGTAICQFSLFPSQFARPIDKIKWLLSSGVQLIKVNELNNPNRGGIGSTDKKKKDDTERRQRDSIGGVDI